jgi:hypothetical protein
MEPIIIKKLFLISHNQNIDRGNLVVENQSLPYRYPCLIINIDVNPRSYKDYVELVRKQKIKLYGIYGKSWLYEFEPSYDSACISVSVQNEDDIFWNIASTIEYKSDNVGVIVHAHRLSELYDFLKEVKEKPILSFKSYDNVYLRGMLHETVVQEKVYLYIISNDELKNFLSNLNLLKKVEDVVIN